MIDKKEIKKAAYAYAGVTCFLESSIEKQRKCLAFRAGVDWAEKKLLTQKEEKQ
jgi:hypothetical protein